MYQVLLVWPVQHAARTWMLGSARKSQPLATAWYDKYDISKQCILYPINLLVISVIGVSCTVTYLVVPGRTYHVLVSEKMRTPRRKIYSEYVPHEVWMLVSVWAVWISSNDDWIRYDIDKRKLKSTWYKIPVLYGTYIYEHVHNYDIVYIVYCCCCTSKTYMTHYGTHIRLIGQLLRSTFFPHVQNSYPPASLLLIVLHHSPWNVPQDRFITKSARCIRYDILKARYFNTSKVRYQA